MISFLEMLYLVGVFIFLGLLLGILERYSNRFLMQTFGPIGVLATAWIGTPIHELGHFIQCFIWGHRVTRVKFLQLHSPNGVLGYVEHQYNPNSLYQQIGNFFIGLGPIISGIGSLIFGMYILLPDSYERFKAFIQQSVSFDILDLQSLLTIGASVFAISESLFTFENLINPLFWIYLFISISISSHIALSKADIAGSGKGLIAIFLFLILFNIAAGILGFNSYNMIVKLTEYNAYILAFSSIAILFSTLTFFGSYILFTIKKSK